MSTLRNRLPTLARALDALTRARARLATGQIGTPRWLLGTLRDIDLRDVAVFGGLAAVAKGVAQIYSPAAWIVVGLFFMWISLRSPRRKSE